MLDFSLFIGQEITKIEKYSYSTWEIKINNSIVTVYNPLRIYQIKKGEKIGCRMNDFLGKKISNIIYKDGCFIKFELDDGFVIDISLLEADYDGPEAMIIENYLDSLIVI